MAADKAAGECGEGCRGRPGPGPPAAEEYAAARAGGRCVRLRPQRKEKWTTAPRAVFFRRGSSAARRGAAGRAGPVRGAAWGLCAAGPCEDGSPRVFCEGGRAVAAPGPGRALSAGGCSRRGGRSRPLGGGGRLRRCGSCAAGLIR